MPWLILELSVLHGLMLEIDELSSFALRIPEIHRNPHYSAGRLWRTRSPISGGVRRSARVFRIADGCFWAKMKTKIEISDFGYGYEDKNEDKNLNSRLAEKYLLEPKRSE